LLVAVARRRWGGLRMLLVSGSGAIRAGTVEVEAPGLLGRGGVVGGLVAQQDRIEHGGGGR